MREEKGRSNLYFETFSSCLALGDWEMENMKAVQVHNYGGPEVLRFEDAPRPPPESGELRSLFNAELTLAQARGNEYQSLVQLYKALGGGWQQ